MKSKASTVSEYLKSLPDDRRVAIRTLRTLIRKRLPHGYEEKMNWGVISYQVPLRVYPNTYNNKPFMYAGLASQKNYMAVYLMNIYVSPGLRKKFEAAYRAAGKKPDMGGCCVRFRRLEDLPLEVIGDAIAATPMAELVNYAKTVRGKK